MGPASYANLQPSWAIQELLKAHARLGSPLLPGETGCLNTRIDGGYPEIRSPGKGYKIGLEMGKAFPVTHPIPSDTGLLPNKAFLPLHQRTRPRDGMRLPQISCQALH